MKSLLNFFYIIFIFCMPHISMCESLLANLDLQQAEKIALDNNKNIQVLKKSLEAAKEQYHIAIAMLCPNIMYSAQKTYYRGKDSLGRNQSAIGGFGLTQPLSTDLYYQLKDYKLNIKEISYDLSTCSNDIIFDVRKSYYSIILYDQQIEVQKENVSLLVKELEKEQHAISVGASTEFDISQYKLEISNALSRYYNSVGEFKTARNTLINLLGLKSDLEEHLTLSENSIPLQKIQILCDKVSNLEIDNDILKRVNDLNNTLSIITENEILHWEQIAVKHNCNIKKYFIRQQRLIKLKNRCRAKYLPYMNAFANYATDNIGSTSLRNMQYHWNFGIQFSWDLFDGGETYYKIKEAEALKQAGDFSYDKIIKHVKYKVRNSLYDLERSLFSYYAAYKGLEHGEKTIKMAKDELNLNVITHLAYRKTINNYIKVKQNLNNASFNLLCAYYALCHATGLETI